MKKIIVYYSLEGIQNTLLKPYILDADFEEIEERTHRKPDRPCDRYKSTGGERNDKRRI